MVPVKGVESSKPSPSCQKRFGTVSTESTRVSPDYGTTERSEQEVLTDDLDVLLPGGSRITEPVSVMSTRPAETATSDDEGFLVRVPSELGFSGHETVHGAVKVVFVVCPSSVRLNDIGSDGKVTNVLEPRAVRVLHRRRGTTILNATVKRKATLSVEHDEMSCLRTH